MISHLSKEAVELIPKSDNTIRSRIIDEFRYQKEKLIGVFRESQSRIHLSLDLWTSPVGNRAYLGVVAHWCDASGEMCNALIGLPEVIGKHSGSNIARCLFDVVKEYGISEKIGYFLLDNAMNNNTVVTAMDSLLADEFREKVNTIKPAE